MSRRPRPHYLPPDAFIGHQPDGRDYERLHDALAIKNAANQAVSELQPDAQDVVHDLVAGFSLNQILLDWKDSRWVRLSQCLKFDPQPELRTILQRRPDIAELKAWLRDNDLP